MKSIKILPLLFCMIIIACAGIVTADAAEIQIIGQYEFSRESIAFTVSDACSGHVCFDQVSVREDGWFATYTNFTEVDEPLKVSPFGRVYVDIYNAEGILQKEITFRYEYSIGITLLEETVEIYMDTTLLSYNWETDELKAYRIPGHSLQESGLYLELHASKFQVGEWTYKCKRTTQGYCALTRENGTDKQTLLSYDGTGLRIGELRLPFVPTVLVVILAVCLVEVYLKKGKKFSIPFGSMKKGRE